MWVHIPSPVEQIGYIIRDSKSLNCENQIEETRHLKLPVLVKALPGTPFVSYFLRQLETPKTNLKIGHLAFQVENFVEVCYVIV